MHEGFVDIFLIGIIKPSFPSFLLTYYLKAMMPHIMFDILHMGDIRGWLEIFQSMID